MKVPFFDYTRVYSTEADRWTAVLQDVLGRSDFILRDDLARFETALADYCGVKHAVGVGNGTDAIWLSLIAVGVVPGDEVILPAHTYIATAAAVQLLGAKPVLVDCGADHLIDVESVRDAISAKTKAIIPVQLNGRTAEMDPLLELAAEHGIPIVEDSAQGLGSKFRGRMAGTLGKTGTYSFFPAKVLGCFGDGGAIVTDDDELGIVLRQMRDHGRDSDGIIQRWGYNSRLDNLHAAILLEKMTTFDRDIAVRREIAGVYQQGLGDISDLLLPPGPDADADHFDTYQNYELESGRRDELRDHLAQCGVGTLIQWNGRALHQHDALDLSTDNLPKTDRLFHRALMLPLNHFMSVAEAQHVVTCVREFYTGSSAGSTHGA